MAKVVSDQQDYSARAVKRSHDELGLFTETFNTMLAQIQQRDQALVLVNSELETRVKERTARLSAACQQLAREIGERRLIEDRLSEAKRHAEKANAAKSEFLANMSHELRTPLHGILSFSRFGIQKHNFAERSKLLDYFEKINASGNTLLQLLNELLDLSGTRGGRGMQVDLTHSVHMWSLGRISP